MKNARRWLAIPVAIILVGIGAALALGAMKTFPGLALFGAASESRSTEVIKSVTRAEQVVLLSLGIQGIIEKHGRTTFLGVDVPGSDRASFVQYSFDAKLGIEGRDVKVVPKGEKNFVVSIPRFIFIGHNHESFKLAAQENGVLSWVTPQNDTAAMITSILNDDTQAQYVESNKEILQDQAKVFYSGIIASVDPTIAIEFEFAE